MHDAHYYESFDISIRITTKMESVLLVIFSLFHSSYCNFSIFLALQHGKIMFTLFTTVNIIVTIYHPSSDYLGQQTGFVVVGVVN